jgi:diguanylate cyclase (GGDEF)-like protein
MHMLGYRLPAVFVILGTIAAGVAVTVVTLLTQPPVTVDQWFFFGLFTVLSAISYVYPIQMEGDVPFSYIMAAAFLFAGALRLPAGLLSLMCYLMVIPGIFILRRPYGWFKDLFNASNYLLSAQAAAVLVHWSGYTGPFELRHLLGVIVAIAVDMALGNFLVALVVGADHGISPFKINVWDVPYLAVDAIICAMGALIGVVSAVSPWAVVLALIPLLMPYWLLKNIHLVRQVDVDAKTGLYNHRYFSGRLPILLAHAKATARPVALLFADLDYLREVNNTYGHLAGDMVLKQVSGVMLEHTRPSDLVARWGGEEFVVILPGTTLSDARHVAERLCDAISNYTFDVGQAEPIRCTISIGVAAAPGHGWDPAELLQIADRAMYAAKAAGRNQVSIAESV